MLTDGDFSGIFNADTAPALKDRTDTKGAILFDASFTGVLENHIDTMEKYKAYAQGVRQLNEFFNIEAVDVLLDELFVKGTLKQLINDHINPDAGVKASKTDNIIDALSRKYTGFALAFKVMQIPKQASSFAMAVSDYSFFGENSNVPKVVSNPLDIVMFMVDTATLIAELGIEIFTKDGPLAQAREMSATFDERIAQGLEGDVYGLESGQNPRGKIKKSKTKAGRAARGVRAAAGATTAIGDIGGVLGYLVNYRRNIKNGMSQEQAVEAFNNYNATQQTRRGTERTPLQNIRHPLIRPFIMFGSTILLQINKVMQATKNIMDSYGNVADEIANADFSTKEKAKESIKKIFGERGRAKDYRSLAMNYAIANVLFTTMANVMLLTKGDEEDKEKAYARIAEAMMGLNLVYQIPLLGPHVKQMEIGARLIQGEDFKPSYGAQFKSDIVNPLDMVVYEIKKANKKDTETGESRLDRKIKPIIEMILGTRVDPAIGLYNLLGGGSEEGIENDVYDLIGVSSSYRPKNKTEQRGGADEMNKSDFKKLYPDLYEEVYGDIDEVNREAREEVREAIREATEE